MNKNDPPLLNNPLNIFQRFFSELYPETAAPPAPTFQQPSPPSTAVPESSVPSRLNTGEQSVRDLRKGLSSGGSDKNRKVRVGSVTAPPAPPGKKTESPTKKGAASSPTKAGDVGEVNVLQVMPSTAKIELKIEPPKKDDRFSRALDSLNSRADDELAGTTAVKEEVVDRIAKLAYREDTIVNLPLFERKIFCPDEANEHAERIRNRWCIDANWLINEHDGKFAAKYKTPSQLRVPPDYVPPERKASKRSLSPKAMAASLGESQKSVASSLSASGQAKKSKKAPKEPYVDPAVFDKERATLMRMNAITNHLRNPRYLSPGFQKKVHDQMLDSVAGARISELKFVQPEACQTLKPSQGPEVSENPNIAAEPSSLQFGGYQPGKVYEQIVKIRNKSALSIRLRVTPPTTPYFSVSLHKPLVGMKGYTFNDNLGATLRKTMDITYQPDLQANQTLPPGQQGMIAPGMAASYVVRFVPDSLRNYHDRLLVCSEWYTIEIPLEATRPRPCFTIPSVVACGTSLVGGSKSVALKVTNSGGDGKCIFSCQASTPSPGTPLPPTSASEGGNTRPTGAQLLASSVEGLDIGIEDVPMLTVGTFTVVPSRLTLKAKESQTVRISFTPEAEQRYEESVYIHLDNGDVLHCTLTGEGIHSTLTLTHVCDIPFLAQTDDPAASPLRSSRRATANRLLSGVPQSDEHIHNNTSIVFDTLSIGAQACRSVTFLNPTCLAVKYKWTVRLFDCNDDREIEDGEEIFAISPLTGAFAANASQKFMISFLPTLPIQYRAVFTLSFVDVPRIGRRTTLSGEDAADIEGSGGQEGDEQNMDKPDQPNQQLENTEAFWDDAGFFSTVPGKVGAVSIITVHGAGKPLEVSLDPPFLANPVPFMAGPNIINSRSVTLRNDSDCVVYYCIDPTDDLLEALRNSTPVELESLSTTQTIGTRDLSLETNRLCKGMRMWFTPRLGSIPAHTSQTVTVNFCFVEVGSYNATIPVHIKNREPAIIPLPMTALVHAAVVRVEPQGIDYGIMVAGQECERRVTLHNTSSVPLTFHIESPTDTKRHQEWAAEKGLPSPSPAVSPGNQTDADGFQPQFTFVPAAGKLKPQESVVVSVFYVPMGAKPTRESFVIHVPGAESTTVEVRGESQFRNACLRPATTDLGSMYVEVPVKTHVTLVNLSVVECPFVFPPFEDPTVATIKIHPHSGVLQPGQELPITISVMAPSRDPLRLLIPCVIEGMELPIACALTCSDIKAASVSLVVTPDPPISRLFSPRAPSISGMSMSMMSASILSSNVGKLTDQEMAALMDCEDGKTMEDYCGFLLRNALAQALEIEDQPPALWLPVIDFGEVNIGESAVRYITARNHSGGEVAVSAWPDACAATSDYVSLVTTAEKDVADAIQGQQVSPSAAGSFVLKSSVRGMSRSSKRTFSPTRQLLTTTHEKAVPFGSKGGHQFLNDKRQLRVFECVRGTAIEEAGGTGVAFVMEHRSSDSYRLRAGQFVTVAIRCFGNTPGVYESSLRVFGRGIAEGHLPIRVRFKGSTLTLQHVTPGLTILSGPNKMGAEKFRPLMEGIVPAGSGVLPMGSLTFPGMIPTTGTDVPRVSKTVKLTNVWHRDLSVEWSVVKVIAESVTRVVVDGLESSVVAPLLDTPLAGLFEVEATTATLLAQGLQAFTVTFSPTDLRHLQSLGALHRYQALLQCSPTGLTPRGEPMAPMYIAVSGSTITPLLEPNPRELRFKECPIGKPNAQFRRTIRLTNPLAVPVTFSLAMASKGHNSMFSIDAVTFVPCQAHAGNSIVGGVDFDDNLGSNAGLGITALPGGPRTVPVKKQSQTPERCTLDPRDAVDVTILLTVTEIGETDPATPGIKTVVDELVITFPCATQTIPVAGLLSFPCVVLDRQELHFAAARGDYQWPKTVTLRNPSIADVTFRLIHVPASHVITTRDPSQHFSTTQRVILDDRPVDDPSVFLFSPNEGVIAGRVGSKANTMQINIQFAPLAKASFVSRFRFEIDNGIPCDLVLSGDSPLQEHTNMLGLTIR